MLKPMFMGNILTVSIQPRTSREACPYPFQSCLRTDRYRVAGVDSRQVSLRVFLNLFQTFRELCQTKSVSNLVKISYWLTPSSLFSIVRYNVTLYSPLGRFLTFTLFEIYTCIKDLANSSIM